MMSRKMLNTLFGAKAGGAVHMQDGGKLPPGIKRATERAKESKSVLPVAGARQARQAIQGYLGMDPSFSVMDPEAQALESAYRGGETASVLGDLFASLTPFAAASAASKVNQVPGLAELIAYHGSPHKFKKFDASKIGTGEGAQAYGHGLYFAENPKVAKQYQADLANYEQPYLQYGKTKIAGQELSDIDLEVLKYLEIGKRDAGRFPHNTVYYAKQAAKNKPEVLKRLDEVGRDVKFGYEKNKGAFYTVDIPDEKIAQMLDWDKPLSQQSANIQSKLKSVIDEQMGKGTWDAWIKHEPDYQNLRNDLFESKNESEISELLRQAGIPGIQYLDQASRDAKQGTRNFVVFPGEEQNIKMLDINGEPQMAAGGAVNMQNNRKVRISDNPDTMRLELLRKKHA